MRILHMCLSCFYIDGYNYQENAIPRMNKMGGHQVKIIASTETYINAKMGYSNPGTYLNEDGIEVTRVAYKNTLPHAIMKKIRSYQDVYQKIEEFQPEVILFHGMAAYELNTVAAYKKKNPQVKLYIDSHEDYNNSARNFVSKNFLHRIFYRNIVKRNIKYAEKVLCISLEVMDFVNEMYKVPREILELYPLGGDILDDREYHARRNQMRQELGLNQNDILLLHSGKMSAGKRTKDIILALREIPQSNIKLVLLGSFAEELEHEMLDLIREDARISFLGWKSREALIDFLCATDIYVQPGTQSSTMQNALCNRCAVLLYPYKSHEIFLKDNGYFVESREDIERCLREIVMEPQKISEMSEHSFEIAKNHLDYKKLAARICI